MWSTTRIGPWTDFVLTLHCSVERHNLCPHMYADDTQIYGFCHPAAASHSSSKCLCVLTRSFVDAVKPAPAKYCQDRGPLVCVQSTATSTTTGRIESWHRLHHANNLSPRPRNLRRLRRVHVDPRVQDHVQLLRHITPVAQHSSVDVTTVFLFWVLSALCNVMCPT